MSNLRNILNEDTSTASADGSCDSSIGSSINGYSTTSAQSLDSRGLGKMSLDFVAPGSRSVPDTASQIPTSYVHHGRNAGYSHQPHLVYNCHFQIRDSGADASAHYPAWTAVNLPSVNRQPGTTGSTDYSKGAYINVLDPNSLPKYHKHSLSVSSRNDGIDSYRREFRPTYGEEERAFIMVCAILRGMTWKEIEKQFRGRFPAGQKRRHQETSLLPAYPKQERTDGGLTCVYYRIREQWGILKVRGVSDEQKPEVKAVVKKTILNVHDFPGLQNSVQ